MIGYVKQPHHLATDGGTYFVSSSTNDRFILPKIAKQIALDSFKYFHNTRYELHAAVVMRDHFHLLLTLLKQEDGTYFKLSSVMNSLKGYSSHKIGEELKVKGGIWQRGYYDVIVNSDEEYSKFRTYILNNPVEARLVDKWEDYPYIWVAESHNSD